MAALKEWLEYSDAAKPRWGRRSNLRVSLKLEGVRSLPEAKVNTGKSGEEL